MRRPELADLMLLATVTLWALNFTVTKYVLSNGFQPIAYGVLRFGSAAVVFAAITWWREHSFALGRRDLWMLAGAALVGIFLNQLAFGYAIKLTTATTVALLFGTLPVMTGIFARLLGIERLNSRFWLAAVLAFGGAALVALGSGTGVSGQLWGDLLGFTASATWAWYTVAVSPLLQRYSTLRVSAVAFTIGTIPLLLVGLPQLARQDYHLPATIWLLLAFAVVGPLVLANLLWFGGISRVGPSRASVFANAQPFLAAIFSLLILSEPLGRFQVVGGILIACAILISRVPTRARAEVVPT
jgi:drug/metabolite transporter (DMT)-like permease